MYKYIFSALTLSLLTISSSSANDKFSILGITPGQALTQAQLNTSIENVSANIDLVLDADFPAIDLNQNQPYEIYRYPLYGDGEEVRITLLAIPKEQLYVVKTIELIAQYKNPSKAPTLDALKAAILKNYGEISHVSMNQTRKDGTSDYSDYRVLYKSGKIGRTADSVNQCEFSKKNGPTGYNENCKTIMSFNTYAEPLKNNNNQTLMATNFEIKITDVEVASKFVATPIKASTPKNPN